MTMRKTKVLGINMRNLLLILLISISLSAESTTNILDDNAWVISQNGGSGIGSNGNQITQGNGLDDTGQWTYSYGLGTVQQTIDLGNYLSDSSTINSATFSFDYSTYHEKTGMQARNDTLNFNVKDASGNLVADWYSGQINNTNTLTYSGEITGFDTSDSLIFSMNAQDNGYWYGTFGPTLSNFDFNVDYIPVEVITTPTVDMPGSISNFGTIDDGIYDGLPEEMNFNYDGLPEEMNFNYDESDMNYGYEEVNDHIDDESDMNYGYEEVNDHIDDDIENDVVDVLIESKETDNINTETNAQSGYTGLENIGTYSSGNQFGNSNTSYSGNSNPSVQGNTLDSDLNFLDSVGAGTGVVTERSIMNSIVSGNSLTAGAINTSFNSPTTISGVSYASATRKENTKEMKKIRTQENKVLQEHNDKMADEANKKLETSININDLVSPHLNEFKQKNILEQNNFLQQSNVLKQHNTLQQANTLQQKNTLRQERIYQ